jgi:peptidoglycan/LPS O-acetylase OafA/YrhL
MDNKQRFVVLDGLRGVAAICVAVFHGAFIFGGRTLLPEAYLAVDFFFLLSGVVVAHAYEDRLRAGHTLDYIIRRAIRLYPMIFIGAALGALFYATDPQARGFIPLWVVGGLYVLATLCLPILRDNIFPTSHGITPLNVPSWSLFFEIFVNAVYGVTARHLRTRRLLAIVIVSLLLESVCIFHFRGANFGFHIPEFWWGFPRVIFPFFAGVLIHRIMTEDRLRLPSLPPMIPAGLLVLTFLTPAHGSLSAIADLIEIALVYPAIIILAMRATPWHMENKVLIWLGTLSYPVYIIHHPFFMWMARMLRAMGLHPEAHPYVWTCVAILCSCMCALGIYEVYDMPVRAWLTRLQKRNIVNQPMRYPRRSARSSS